MSCNEESDRLPSVQLPLSKSYTYASPIPQSVVDSNEACMLGVDEAGRGPCLGPMVYAVCYYPASRHDEFKALGFDDSKKLTEERRVDLAKIIQQNLDWVGWAVQVIAPQEISTNMLSRPPYNLNEMAHSATMQLIRNVLNAKINVTEIFVDPVGPSQSYKAKLSRYFPGIEITVEPRADSLYASVSAASICAKVTRDQVLQHWIWLEPGLEGKVSKSFGSGYPSDPNTVKWLGENEDPFFGFPSLIRFSWKTISNRMDTTLQVEWSEDEDEEDTKPKNIRKRRTQAQAPTANKDTGSRQHHMNGRTYKQLCLETVNTL
ncbi:ribonuclease H-like domain-containing protein [Zychaea mexicana]|uniref:ribonuclease H-like domain-containing protein n=1 Tax=Zychaea mexicana TaxID=64656 RepID=UPI0022FE62C8|nr:ribonuclease H-like domain-containing protein [Zychaea mexicana]KAI9492406.1 ribonuclease H-like domain-containing protein [Zychaea mexicana]